MLNQTVINQMKSRKQLHVMDTNPEFVAVFTHDKYAKTKAECFGSDLSKSNNIYANIAESQDTAVGFLINSKYFNAYSYQSPTFSEFVKCIINVVAMGNNVRLYDLETKTMHKFTVPSNLNIHVKRAIQAAYLGNKYKTLNDKTLDSILKYYTKHKFRFPNFDDLDTTGIWSDLQNILLTIEQHKLEDNRIAETEFRKYEIIKASNQLGCVSETEVPRLYDTSLAWDYDINVHMQFSDEGIHVADHTIKNVAYAASYVKYTYVTTDADKMLDQVVQMYYAQVGFEPEVLDRDALLDELDILEQEFETLKASKLKAKVRYNFNEYQTKWDRLWELRAILG